MILFPLKEIQPSFPIVPVCLLLNSPYLWGGGSRKGIDCSGLVQLALNVCGINCPRDTDMQEESVGKRVKLTEAKKGDLVFWRGHVGILSEDASKFSVPSKILNYLCAGKPIILSAPQDNLSATIIKDSNSGKVFDPHDLKGINNFLKTLVKDNTIKIKYSLNARDYANKNFKIKNISMKFENLINNLNKIK